MNDRIVGRQIFLRKDGPPFWTYLVLDANQIAMLCLMAGSWFALQKSLAGESVETIKP